MAASSGITPLEAKKIIGSFRVLDLKQYLRSLNVSANGRKKELQDRAIRIIETGNSKALEVLSDIHKKTTPTHQLKTPPKPPPTNSTANPPSFLPLHIKHPDVKFRNHPFYQHVDSVYRTTALESSAYMKKAMTIQFHLTPQHIRHIFESETTPGNYRTQVILRFCKKETSYEQEDFYPGNCYITINNQQCPIPGYNPNYSMRPEYKRNGKPINITSYIHTSPAIVNTLCITWNHDILYTQGFCFSVDLMTCLSPSDLLQKLKSKGTRSSDVCKVMIKDKLSMDRNSEISTTSLKISLICPLGKTRLNNPCKSTSCDHLQCFDASIYLQMNERKPKWICPVCDRPAPFTDLLIDGYLLEICEKSSEEMIEFDTDGSWHSITKNNNKDKIVSLTPPSSITIHDSPTSKLKEGLPDSNRPSVVIDLTSDSDDEGIRPVVTTSTNSVLPEITESHSKTSTVLNPDTHSSSNGNETRTNTIMHLNYVNPFSLHSLSSQTDTCSRRNEHENVLIPEPNSSGFSSSSRSPEPQSHQTTETHSLSADHSRETWPHFIESSRSPEPQSLQTAETHSLPTMEMELHSRAETTQPHVIEARGTPDDYESHRQPAHTLTQHSLPTRVPVISQKSTVHKSVSDPFECQCLMVKIPLFHVTVGKRAPPTLFPYDPMTLLRQINRTTQSSINSLSSGQITTGSSTGVWNRIIHHQTMCNNVTSSPINTQQPTNPISSTSISMSNKRKHRRKGPSFRHYIPPSIEHSPPYYSLSNSPNNE